MVNRNTGQTTAYLAAQRFQTDKAFVVVRRYGDHYWRVWACADTLQAARGFASDVASDETRIYQRTVEVRITEVQD